MHHSLVLLLLLLLHARRAETSPEHLCREWSETRWPTWPSKGFEGTPDLIEAKIRQDVFTAVKGSWMTWIPAHTINFAFVPSDMRLLYINTIQIFFNMFMSVIGNTEAVAAE